MSIKIIAAVAKNNVIGKNNNLPWYIPEDLKHFKNLTLGKTILMGRKTFESIMARLGKPLPDRVSIVITKDKKYQLPEGVMRSSSLDSVISNTNEDIWIIGGASIYEQAMSQAAELYITHIDQEVDGDAFFPAIKADEWKKIEEDKRDGYSFIRYVRK